VRMSSSWNVPPGVRLLNGLGIFYGLGDPADSTDLNVTHAAQGSLYLRRDGADPNSTLYLCIGTRVDSVTGATLPNWVAK
jgi:hypothetical protein